MEVLSDILRSMRVEGSVYFCDHLSAPWSEDFGKDDAASFHQVRRGDCWVSSGETSERLGSGDLLFVEPGRTHVLSNHEPGTEPPGSGDQTLLLCGYFQFTNETGTPLMEVLPSLTIVHEEDLYRHPWLKGTLDQLSTEYLAQQPGSELVVNKLTEIVLVELIRFDFGRSNRSQFVRALSDKQISRALQHMHNEPQRAWTLQSMAEAIGMSRAAFARRFKDMVGQSMFEYLTTLRVQRAKELLRDTQRPLYEIAGLVGYESDLAFTKTFKKHAGMTPTRYRKHIR